MKRLSVLAGVVVAALALAASTNAAPGDWYQLPRFGAYYLTPPCCGGDSLNGTGAAILVSGINPDSSNCLLFRSTAESASNYLIQSGLLRCGSGQMLDGTCSLSNNLVKFVEKDVAGSYTCYPHGAASLNTTYTATPQNTTGTLWYAYIDGIAYENNSFSADAIAESGEHTSDSCSGWSGHGVFGQSSLWPWKRYVIGSASWKTVQSSYQHAGCWALSGAPPNSFDISH